MRKRMLKTLVYSALVLPSQQTALAEDGRAIRVQSDRGERTVTITDIGAVDLNCDQPNAGLAQDMAAGIASLVKEAREKGWANIDDAPSSRDIPAEQFEALRRDRNGQITFRADGTADTATRAGLRCRNTGPHLGS